jgi:NhaP-type Na+/H+ or K+/H+ antiporter
VNEQAVIWFSGLRGAIALALAVEFPTALQVHGTEGEGCATSVRALARALGLSVHARRRCRVGGRSNFCYQREHVVACTIVVVMCTVFFLGGFTKPVLNLCGIDMGMDKPAAPSPERRNKSRRWLKRALVAADQSVLRPVLIADYELEAAAASTSAAAAKSVVERREERL